MLTILQTTHHQINTDVLGIVAILASPLGGLIAAIVWNFLRQLDCFSDKYRELRQEKTLEASRVIAWKEEKRSIRFKEEIPRQIKRRDRHSEKNAGDHEVH